MTPERWNHIKRIVDQALDREAEGQPAGLATMCDGDSELAAEVDRLLSEYRRISGFLEQPAAGPIMGADRAFEAGQLAAGRYRIVTLLGEGGMGEVWEARDQELRGKRVALKVLRSHAALDPRLARRMTEEVLLAREITHPNVCPIYDIGAAETLFGNAPFLIMKLIEGRTLRQVLGERGPLPPAEVLRIASQIAAGLDAAHRAGVVHRDLKPGNVMLQNDQHGSDAIVTDFGLASNCHLDDSILQPDGDTAIVGTPDYMAPEQRIGGAEVTPLSDIYAFGLVLHEMVTGHLPTAAGMDLSALPTGWAPVLARCLSPEPKRRSASAAEIVRSLKRAGKRHRLLRWVAAAVLFTIVVGGGLATGGYRLLRRLLSPLPASRHAVVLPFRNASGDAAWDAVASGIGETVAAELARAQRPGEDFWVIANSDVTAQHVATPAQARQIFGTNLAITATLERQGSNARLHMQAVTPDGRTLVFRDLVSPSAELFRLPSQAASEAAGMLEVAYKPAAAGDGTAPKNAEAYRLYEAAAAAMRTQDSKQVDSAISLLSQALDQDPAYALAYAKLAQAYAARWNSTRQPELIDLANRSIDRAAALNGNSVVLHHAAASVANTFRKNQQALGEAGWCLALDPAEAECALYMAGAYDGLGRLNEAEKMYLEAIDLRPNQWLMYNRLGSFYYRHARYADAERMFRSTIQTASWNPLGYNNLAGLYLATRRFAEAADLLTASNRLRPTGSGLSNLGTCFFYLGRYAEAAAEYEKATNLEPRAHEHWHNLGDAYAKMPGFALKARACYRKALDLIVEQQRTAPAQEDFAIEALYRAKLGDLAGARRALEEAHITNDNPGLRFREARVRELTGDRDGALRAIGEALSGGFSRNQVEQAPELERLRADPRYSKIVTK